MVLKPQAFNEAKTKFKEKTKDQPSKVEGNWEAFKTQTTGYFDHKTAEVSKFTAKLTYSDVRLDVLEYKQGMRNAINPLIDNDGALKSDLVKYKQTLHRRSISLKNSLKEVYDEKIIKEQFATLQTSVATSGITIDASKLAESYLSKPKRSRLPMNQIVKRIKGFTDKTEDIVISAAVEMRPIFTTEEAVDAGKIINDICLNRMASAKKISESVLNSVKLRKTIYNIQEKTGINRLSENQIKSIVLIALKLGVKLDKAEGYIVSRIDIIRKVDSQNFDAIIKNHTPEDLQEFVMMSVFSLSAHPSQNVTAILKHLVVFESHTAQITSFQTNRINKANQKLKEQKARIKTLQQNATNPITPQIALAQQEIAQANFDIANANRLILLSETKRAIAQNYLAMRTTNAGAPKTQSILSAVLKAKTSTMLIGITSVNRCPSPSELRFLQTAETAEDAVDFERERATWLVKNPDARSDFNEFYKTGKPTRHVRYFHRKRIAYYKDTYRDAEISMYTMGGDFSKIKSKYGSLNHVPAMKFQGVAMRMTSYISHLHGMQLMLGKMLAMYQTSTHLLNSPELKEIKRCRIKAKNLAKRMKQVQTFMGLPFPIANIDDLAISPLQETIIERELSPKLKAYQKTGAPIASAYKSIATEKLKLKNFGRRSAYSREKMLGVDGMFKRGLSGYASYFIATDKSRGIAISTLKDLNAMYNSPGQLAHLPPSMQRVRKRIIKRYINYLTSTLNDSRSPLSSIGRANMKKEAAQFAKAYENLKNDRLNAFYKSIAIVALSTAFSMVGGWAAGAAGRALFTSGSMLARMGTSGFVIAGQSVGGAVGTRFAKTGFLAAGGASSTTSLGSIWELGGLKNDIGRGLVMNFGLKGTASLIGKGLKMGATSVRFNRMARVFKYSRKRFKNVRNSFLDNSLRNSGRKFTRQGGLNLGVYQAT